MKRAIVFLMLVAITDGYAQKVPMSLAFTLPVGTNTGEIEFALGPYTGNAPHDFAFINGREAWLAQTGAGVMLDVDGGKVLTVVPYPESDLHAAFQKGDSYCFGEGWSASVRDAPVITQFSQDFSRIIDYHDFYGKVELLWSRPYVFGGLAFFFKKDGGVLAIQSDGKQLTSQETREMLLGWDSKTWYPEADRKRKNHDLLNTGKYLIVNGLLYPASCAQAADYFTALGNGSAQVERLKEELGDAPPRGESMNGDIYVRMDDGMHVFDQRGDELAIIDVILIDPWNNLEPAERNNASSLYCAVRPNGDLFSVYAIRDDKAYFHRAVKTWGNDLIGMARVGVTYGGEAEMRQRLQGFSSIELRLLRNALFALHGYAFQSWDLTTYFGGYDWYTPDPKVKDDSSILSPEQKRLFDIVVGIEKQGVVTQ